MAATGPEFRPGDIIDGTKYRVVQPIGAGGMGVVYQVVKPPNIGGVLKLMSTELATHDEHRMRFFDEVRILAQLDHPNIVKVYDYDILPDGTPFYVMELLSGRTVRDVIHTMGRVRPRVAYEITRQLLEALQCAHTNDVPVIHRDIKPENIFLHAPRHGEPVVKLIDFGVSAVADRKHDGAFVGTWSYAAPEQIRGDRPTAATDLYAVGLVLYEMLAGVGPFDHYPNWAQICEAQCKEAPAPVSKFAPWVPPSIVSLIDAALAKDPRARPRDAYAFAERLFELEWATDGENPRDLTTEGPSAVESRRRTENRPPSTRGAPDAAPIFADVEILGDGPLSRVLSTLTGNPSSKNLAAAKPALDRLGDVPLIGVPHEAVRSGPTWRGMGEQDTNALLAGLGPPDARPGPESRDPTAVTVSAPPAPGLVPGGARDTFASQQSDALALPRTRSNAVFVALAVLMSGVGITLLVVFWGGRTSPPPTEATAGRSPAPVVPTPPPTPSPAETAAEVPVTVVAPVVAVPTVAQPVVAPNKTKAKAGHPHPNGGPSRPAPPNKSESSSAPAPSAPPPSKPGNSEFIRTF